MRKFNIESVIRSAKRLEILEKMYRDHKKLDAIPVIKKEIRILVRRAIRLWWETSSCMEKWQALTPDLPAVWASETEEKFSGLPCFDIVKRYQEITTQLGYKWARTWGVK